LKLENEHIKDDTIKKVIQLCSIFLSGKVSHLELTEVNWASLIAFSKKHRISKIIAEQLKNRSTIVPSEHLSELHNRNKKATLRMLTFTAEIANLTSLLKEVSVNSIPLKGPVAAMQIYNDFTYKDSRDIDILINQNQLGVCISAIEHTGYQCSYDYNSLNRKQKKAFQKANNQLTFYHQKKKIQLEIHWRLFANPHLLSFDFNELIQEGSTIQIGQETIYQLSQEHLLLYLCVHGAKHHWSLLYWLIEVASLIKREDYNWDELLEKSIKIGIDRPLVQALILSNQIFNSKIPSNIIDYYQRDSQIKSLVKTSKDIIFENKTHTQKRGIWNYVTILLYKMSLRKELKYKLAYCNKTSINDFDLIKLPEALFFLYFWFRPVFWCMRYLIQPSKKT
jgi:hypothetical protein